MSRRWADSDMPTDEEFRKAGYTPNARHYPMSEAAFEWLCRVWNGIAPDRAPRAWRYAPCGRRLVKVGGKAVAA